MLRIRNVAQVRQLVGEVFSRQQPKDCFSPASQRVQQPRAQQRYIHKHAGTEVTREWRTSSLSVSTKFYRNFTTTSDDDSSSSSSSNTGGFRSQFLSQEANELSPEPSTPLSAPSQDYQDKTMETSTGAAEPTLSASKPVKHVRPRASGGARIASFVPLEVDTKNSSYPKDLPNFASDRIKQPRPRASNPKKFRVSSWRPAVINAPGEGSQTGRAPGWEGSPTRKAQQNGLPPGQQESFPTDNGTPPSNTLTYPLFGGGSASLAEPYGEFPVYDRRLRTGPNRKAKRQYRRHKREARKPKTVAQHLRLNKQWVPLSQWVIIHHTSPVSSLETVLEGINPHLDNAMVEGGGIVNLDAHWDPHRDPRDLPLRHQPSSEEGEAHPPMLDLSEMFPAVKEIEDSTKDDDDEIPGMALEEKLIAYNPEDDIYRWVDEARIILSPYGRPAGWKVKFLNRSIVYAFLNSTRERDLMCAWKVIAAEEWNIQLERKIMPEEMKPHLETSFRKVSANEKIKSIQPLGNNHRFYEELSLDIDSLDWLDDSVVRVENCDERVTEQDLLHVFSRYDLLSPSIVRWVSKSEHQEESLVFFVRCADASWARAAVREKQSHVICGKHIRLIQFPRQLIRSKQQQQVVTRPREEDSEIQQEQQSMMAD